MRKFLVLCVVLILTLISPIYAFADDPEESDSSGDRLATEEELEDLDARLLSTSDLIYNTLSDNGTKATSYTTTDIYNWLNNYLGTDFQNHGSTYPALMYARINSINSTLNSFSNLFSSWDTWINNISNNSTSIYLLLDELVDSINPDYQTVGISIYDLLHSISTALTSIDGDDGDLTLIETLVYMYNELEDINTTLSSILNSSYSIDNRLVTIYTYLTSFRSDMNSGFSNVNANLALMISNLQSLQNDYNNITWLNANITPHVFRNLEDAINDSNYLTSATILYNDFYIRIPQFVTIYPPNSYLMFLNLNIYDLSIINIHQYNSTNSTFVPVAFNTFINRYYTSFYIIPQSNISTSLIFKVSIVNRMTFNTGSSFVKYILSDSLDYYSISSSIFDSLQNSILYRFNQLYASDDLIAAKEDQQDYEDQAIQDFTGSGSAAASGQDLGDMKSISGAIKSGLQTGGSVNNALAPFNTNSGFWAWFSQSNYDNINNIPSSNTRSGNSSQPDIIDFYTNNQYTLQGLLSGGGN